MDTPTVSTKENTRTPKRERVPLGLVLYEGPSAYDGAPVVAILTGLRNGTANRKTGDMLQTWILRADVAPVVALKDGSDTSICGACPLRPSASGGCYVNVGQAPGAVYRAFRAGRYAHADAEALARYVSGRAMRFGAYGDPAAVPSEVWNGLLAHASKHTAYSHGATVYGMAAMAPIAAFSMVSASTLLEARQAWSHGFRTFRVGAGAPVAGEIACPSERISCADCGLCDGNVRTATRARALPNVFIPAHGATAKRILAERAPVRSTADAPTSQDEASDAAGAREYQGEAYADAQAFAHGAA